MNTKKNRAILLQRIKTNTIELPPPEGTPAKGNCWIPLVCIKNFEGRLEIVNKYIAKSHRGKRRYAHVEAAIYRYGRLPRPDEQVLHDCDTKCCCSPDHVRFGSGSENVREAIQRRLLKIPKNREMPKGEKNRKAKLTNKQVSNLKWLYRNKGLWYSGEIAENHKLEVALAIYFGASPETVRRIMKYRSWRHIRPVRPQSLPDATSIPANAVPPAPDSQGPIGRKGAEKILVVSLSTKNVGALIKSAAAEYDCSREAVRAILNGKSYKYIRTDILRGNVSVERVQPLTGRQVQRIRATWDQWIGSRISLPGALARWGNCSRAHLWQVVKRKARTEVLDDPEAIIPREQLQFNQPTKHGSDHAGAKLTDEQALELLRERASGATLADLAKVFPLTEARISQICRGHGYPVAQARFRAEEGQSPDASADDGKSPEVQQ